MITDHVVFVLTLPIVPPQHKTGLLGKLDIYLTNVFIGIFVAIDNVLGACLHPHHTIFNYQLVLELQQTKGFFIIQIFTNNIQTTLINLLKRFSRSVFQRQTGGLGD